jgi:hypothetical protein
MPGHVIGPKDQSWHFCATRSVQNTTHRSEKHGYPIGQCMPGGLHLASLPDIVSSKIEGLRLPTADPADVEMKNFGSSSGSASLFVLLHDGNLREARRGGPKRSLMSWLQIVDFETLITPCGSDMYVREVRRRYCTYSTVP